MNPETATLHFQRRIALPPERLWEVLTDPGHREKWGAPTEGAVLSVVETDTRVGGRDRHRCGPAEAPEFEVETRWYRLAPPAAAVFTETVIAGEERIATSLVTYAVAPGGGGSALSVTVAVSSFVGAEALDDFASGWEGGLANLERHVASLTGGAPR